MTVTQGDVLEAAARLEYDGGEDVINVYQIRNETVAPLTDVQAVEDILDLLEALYTLVLAYISVTTVFRDVRIRNVTDDALLGVFAWPTLTAGDNTSSELPHGVSAMVSFPTSVPRVTMRKYLPRMTEGGLDTPGLWTPAAVLDFVDFGAYLLPIKTNNTHLWRYGYFSPKVAAWVTPVSAIVTNVPAYQRRRKPGRGS